MKMIDKDKKPESIPRLPIHDLGALQGLTRWIGNHEDGISEWLKNVRAAYQESRANVEPKDRVAVFLIKDNDQKSPHRMGLLDVGGFTFEDVKGWSVWNDPEASSRGGPREEENQGNGGKAYMYKQFKGPAFILGVKNNLLNNAGFIGKNNGLARGLPRFYPSSTREIWQPGDVIKPNKNEKDIRIEDWKDYLIKELLEFGTGFDRLPKEVKKVLEKRRSFTLVQGIDPINWTWEGNIKQFIKQITRHNQSARAIRQVRFYIIHNDKVLFNNKPMELEKIEPYPDFEDSREYTIPITLLAPNGNQVSTIKSSSGKHKQGKISLFTSKDNMEALYKTLKPRWVVTYETKETIEDVGQKSISEIAPATPGSQFIYAKVELDALSPDSVDAGRKRPNNTPLVLAVDKFLEEKIEELAKEINEKQTQKLSESVLDEIQKDNEYLNEVKNEFLPSEGEFEIGSIDDNNGQGKKKKKKTKILWGKKAKTIKVSFYSLKVARGFKLNLIAVLNPSVRDAQNKPVPASIKWKTNNNKILELDKGGNCSAKKNGNCKIQLVVEGNEGVATPWIPVEVWSIKEIFLAPTDLKVQVGHNKQITAQVVDEKGNTSSEVLINWMHNAENPNLIKISPRGHVFGNIIGKTEVKAWINDPKKGNIFSNIETKVEVIKSTDEGEKGSGFPKLLITDKDKDPETGGDRHGDPNEPALWQLPSDYKHNVWWLNLQSKDALFAHNQRKKDLKLWRFFHANILIDMMIQVHMKNEYTKKQENEKRDIWVSYKSALEAFEVQLKPKLWEKLTPWILGEENGN